MVDNVLNNGFGEKERREEIRKAAESYQQKTGATITFFAAVCEEFPSMGNYFDGLTVEQVTDRYKQILADPRLSYMGNGMGFELHDSSLPDYLNIINLRKKWKGICSQVPFIVLKYRQGCI